MKARYSIIVPVRNGGAHLRECVQGVLAQTRSDWELLVLDNASEDDNLAWLRSLNEPRVRIFPSERPLSIEENWNRALSLPKSEFMAFFGHDDRPNPEYLQTMHELIAREPEASLYFARFRYMDARGQTVHHSRTLPARETAAQYLAALFSGKRDTYGAGYMMRAADYERVGGIPLFKGLLFADDALWMTLMQKSYCANAPEECFAVRVHPQSAGARASASAWMEALPSYLARLQELAARDPRFAAALQQFGPLYFKNYCYLLYVAALKVATLQNRRVSRSVRRTIRGSLAQVSPQAVPALFRAKRIVAWEIINRYPLLRALYLKARKTFRSL